MRLISSTPFPISAAMMDAHGPAIEPRGCIFVIQNIYSYIIKLEPRESNRGRPWGYDTSA